jgi:hypothetical protein
MKDQILRTLNMFHEPLSVVELRLIGLKNGRHRPVNASGFFTDGRNRIRLFGRWKRGEA